MGLQKTIRKLSRNYRDYGTRITALKVSSSLISSVYTRQTYRIYRIHLEDHPNMHYDNKGFTFRLLHLKEHHLVKQIEEMEEWLEGKISEKLSNGSQCLIAEASSRVAGFNLVSFGNVYMPIVNRCRVFRTTEAWSEQITVGKDFRGRGLATLLRYHTFDELKKRGIKRFYGGTLPTNTANRKLSQKVGFQEIADIHYVKKLNSQNWTYTRKFG